MINKNLAYLLKAYLRECSFSTSELSKITKLSHDRIKAILDQEIVPEPQEALQIQEKTKIPKYIFWVNYFKTVAMACHEEPTFDLINMQEIHEMLKNNKAMRKKFKHNSVPSDEVWFDMEDGYDFLNPQTVHTLWTLEFKKNSLEEITEKDIKELSKKRRISPGLIKKTLKPDYLPTIKELLEMNSMAADGFLRTSIVRGYLSQVNKSFNLGYRITEANSELYQYILDKTHKYQKD